ncbi:MAG: hypothetical protein K5930_00015 [Treponemataceae bacterium]|nr:hypothetical protein [Treponemataceae bacterium]
MNFSSKQKALFISKTMIELKYLEDDMPQEDYSKLVATILALSYQQRLSLFSVLQDSLLEEEPAPPSLRVSSVEDLHQKLDEGLASIKEGRCIPADVVHQRFHEKYGI